MPLPRHFLRIGAADRELSDAEAEPVQLRRQIEPWLTAVVQSEHLSLLIGSGLSNAIAGLAGSAGAGMGTVDFAMPDQVVVSNRATALAQKSARGDPNIEDQIRAAQHLIDGLEILGEEARADEWRTAVRRVLGGLAASILAMERSIDECVRLGDESGKIAAGALVTFLLSFSSRPSSRDRLSLFTTNYDRILEFGCDLAGIRTLDRFVGSLEPRFRASRLDVDMHYNPPGARGEPRYLEGVVRLSKLHGSIDWSADDGVIRRVSVPFGSRDLAITDPYQSLMVFPNATKDTETNQYPYAELFRDFAASLCRPNSALLTYGYGFGDDHINRVLMDMLSIPSTHVVIIARSDSGGRIASFLGRIAREEQVSVLLGPHLGDLATLVRHYLPRPAIDAIQVRQTSLLRQRQGPELAETDKTAIDE